MKAKVINHKTLISFINTLLSAKIFLDTRLRGYDGGWGYPARTGMTKEVVIFTRQIS
jgi:hypothetical protein